MLFDEGICLTGRQVYLLKHDSSRIHKEAFSFPLTPHPTRDTINTDVSIDFLPLASITMQITPSLLPLPHLSEQGAWFRKWEAWVEFPPWPRRPQSCSPTSQVSAQCTKCWVPSMRVQQGACALDVCQQSEALPLSARSLISSSFRARLSKGEEEGGWDHWSCSMLSVDFSLLQWGGNAPMAMLFYKGFQEDYFCSNFVDDSSALCLHTLRTSITIGLLWGVWSPWSLSGLSALFLRHSGAHTKRHAIWNLQRGADP